MNFIIKTIILLLLTNSLFAHESQFSASVEPIQAPKYYINQAEKYFDTLDTYADPKSRPLYASHVIRWEWYPWLFLTGFKDHWMWLDRFVKLYPTKVINRDCRFFKVQPFARCRVTFHYLLSDSYVDIYEEFTFNKSGEMNFIEAWSDLEGRRPMNVEMDYWAEDPKVKRLSTKVPGLGSKKGKINRWHLRKLSKLDKDLKNLKKRLRFTLFYWTKESLRLLIKGHDH
ncbi:MAG: hypothetical protein K9K67_15160 [Bacteriovoracaceae bacterium]|nr:hypothetical protein [Bacteriovoracaceae bacterium]